MLRTNLLYGLCLAALFTGCTKDDTDDSDTETDTDTDTDTDSDTDSDTDTDVEYTSFSADLTYKKTVNDVVECDFDVALQSTSAYTGTCPGCDFAFNVDATAGDVRTDCTLDDVGAIVTFQNEAGITDSWIGWTTSYVYEGYYYGDFTVAYANELIRGYSYDGYDDYIGLSGTYTYTGSYGTAEGDLIDGSTASFDGTTLLWDLNLSMEDDVGEFDEECEGDFEEGTGPANEGGEVGSLDCQAEDNVDIWTFTAAANADISVALDTLAAETAGDMTLTIVGPSDCVVAYVDDAFDCFCGPDGCGAGGDTDTDGGDVEAYSRCPAVDFNTGSEAGEYQVIAGLYGCPDDLQATAGYTFTISGATGDATLAEDDYTPTVVTTVTDYEVSMTGAAE